MTDCWDCIHLEKRCGGFQYCLLNNGRRNVDANKDRCNEWTSEEPIQEEICEWENNDWLYIEEMEKRNSWMEDSND